MNAIPIELSTTLALGQIGWTQMIVLGLLGVLIFGKRLPEVGKSLGKGIVEFKKGLSGIDTDLPDAGASTKQLDNAAPPPAASAAPATESHTADTADTEHKAN